MATESFVPSFTYAGPSVGAALVVGAFNEQMSIAQDRLQKADEYTRLSMEGLGNAPQVEEIEAPEILFPPHPPQIPQFTSADMEALYNSTADDIKDLLADRLSEFFADYFPLSGELVSAQSWVNQALTTGGTGLAPAVEDQIWQRDRARLLKDGRRATEDAMSTWAARGYALPPGALVGQVNRIEQDVRDKIAESSRTRAIEAARMELENIKFAVEKAISLRLTAIQAAGEYLKVVALGPQLGIDIASAMVDAKVKMAQTLTTLYGAQLTAFELPIKLKMEEIGLNVDVRKANLSAQIATIEARVRSVEAAAQATGTQAAAALNALSAHASFGASEQV